MVPMPGKRMAEGGGDEAEAEDAVGDAFVEGGFGGKFFV